MCINFSGAEYDTKLGGLQGSTVKTLLEELYEKVKTHFYFVREVFVNSFSDAFTLELVFIIELILTLQLIFTLESTLLLATGYQMFLRVFMVFSYI